LAILVLQVTEHLDVQLKIEWMPYTVIDMSAERSFGDFDGYLKVGNLWDSDDNISLFYGKRAPRARYLDVGIRYDF
jgi:hypothetical protein